jgi:hypothetical protein
MFAFFGGGGLDIMVGAWGERRRVEGRVMGELVSVGLGNDTLVC